MNAKDMTRCALFTALLCVCSIIRIPIPISPVPITLQFFAVFLAGAALGKKWGTVCAALYLLLGAAGLPVFSGMQSGPGVLAGPTGGFLLGFVPGAFLIGALHERTGNIWLAMVSGAAAMYAFGTCQLMVVANMGLTQALSGAVLPFVAFDAVKMLLAVAVFKTLTVMQARRIL